MFPRLKVGIMIVPDSEICCGDGMSQHRALNKNAAGIPVLFFINNGMNYLQYKEPSKAAVQILLI